MFASALLLVMLAGSDSKSETMKYIPAKDVEAQLVKPPARLVKTDNYEVMTMRRTAPGQAEKHDKDTDVVYVIDGSATLITGGTMPDAKVTEPGETRSASIKDGKTQKVSKGDVITIPKGLPHFFSAIDGTFTYFVVKVR
jgi:quercetin dioxygenase-like cupin family protein